MEERCERGMSFPHLAETAFHVLVLYTPDVDAALRARVVLSVLIATSPVWVEKQTGIDGKGRDALALKV